MQTVKHHLKGRAQPIFAAHRGYTDEPWRIDRLKRVFLSATRRLERVKLDGSWDGAIRLMHDRKGTLTIMWRSEDDFRRFAFFVKAAWNGQQEWSSIQHLSPAGLPFDAAVQLLLNAADLGPDRQIGVTCSVSSDHG